jgi:hypothetical protein
MASTRLGFRSMAGCSEGLQLEEGYVHPGVPQAQLFARTAEAETAITTLRAAIKDMYARTGNPVEAWQDDDVDAIDPRKGGFTNTTVIHAGMPPPRPALGSVMSC